MNKKVTLILIEVLVLCMITCIGFSAWIFSTPLNGEFTAPLNGSISSEKTILYDDYIKITKKNPFSLTPLGFLGSGGPWTGELSIEFEIDLEKCQEFATDNKIKVKLVLGLSCEDLNGIFLENSPIEITANSRTEIVSGIETEKNNMTRNTIFYLDLSASKKKFIIIFQFDTKNEANYLKLYNTFFDETTPTGAQFALNLSIYKDVEAV